MHELVTVTIDGQTIQVPAEFTIMKAAYQLGIDIPRLCYLEGVHEKSNCRVCVVKVKGMKGLQTSCSTQVEDGMEVETNTREIYDAVSFNLELLAANHKLECWKCTRENSCEFLDLLRRFNVENDFSNIDLFRQKKIRINDASDAMILDSGKCVLCGRCISACEKETGLSILGFNERGADTYVGPANFHDLDDSGCIYCGKCIQACPTGAIRGVDHIRDFDRALLEKDKTVVVQVAPAVRAALGEEFGYPIGSDVEGKMFAALKKLGIDEIVDTNFAADLTIMEEGNEFLKRLNGEGPLPLFTSCSPGWVNLLELNYPELMPHLSSCKSPQQMAGALIKTYFADKLDKEPEDIISVSIMPCVAKKAEAKRKEMGRDGYRDVDFVLTTREFAQIIRHREIPFRNLEPVRPFGALASYTGAGSIFGATGGVMEAALRTVSDTLGESMDTLDFEEVRGIDEVKEATYTLAGKTVRVAVVHGGKAIREFLDHMKTTDKTYHFVEFMGCSGGCVNGGGQPIVPAKKRERFDVRQLRARVLYDIDRKAPLRMSHENPAVNHLYETFLGEPGSERSHHLLHTTYASRGSYTRDLT